jgi:hypothetical protein
MKARISLLLGAVVLTVLSSFRLYTQDTAQNIQTRVIDGFERPGTWEVKFSKFRSPTFKKRALGHTNPEAQQVVQPENSQAWISWFQATDRDFSFLPDGLPPESRGVTEKTIMGVRANFEIPGYNWIVVQPKEILPLYGVVKSLDCWIWGGGYRYDIDFIVMDYNGFFYTLPAGTVDHYGWKNFRVKIPDWIPQKQRWLPKSRPLSFVRFKVTAQPDAREDNFHIYFDYMQVQADIYVERFNGDELVKLNWQKRGVRGSGERGSDEGGSGSTQQNQPAQQNAPQGQPNQPQQPPATRQ